jgi:hypothetical protein
MAKFKKLQILVLQKGVAKGHFTDLMEAKVAINHAAQRYAETHSRHMPKDTDFSHAAWDMLDQIVGKGRNESKRIYRNRYHGL